MRTILFYVFSKHFVLLSDLWDGLSYFNKIFKTKIREEAWAFQPLFLRGQLSQKYSLPSQTLSSRRPRQLWSAWHFRCSRIRQGCRWDCIFIQWVVFVHLMENTLGLHYMEYIFLLFNESLPFNDSMILVPYFWNGNSTQSHLKWKSKWLLYIAVAMRQNKQSGLGAYLWRRTWLGDKILGFCTSSDPNRLCSLGLLAFFQQLFIECLLCISRHAIWYGRQVG